MTNDNGPRIVALPTPQKRINEATIRILESALQDAKDGGIEAVALVGVLPHGGFRHAFSETEHSASVLGGLAYVMHRISLALDSTPDEPDLGHA